MGEGRRVIDDDAGSTGLLDKVGQRVRMLRKELGISRRVLSETSGVSMRYLAQLESGEGNISIVLLAKVAAALKCELPLLMSDQLCFDRSPFGGEVDDQLQRLMSLLQKTDAHTRQQVLDLLEASSGRRQQRFCLIGLRGAGKSTLGRMAGGALGLPFVELNEQIEQLAGMPVSEVIALYGPAGYRDLESKALDQVSMEHGCVILAAAGGVVSNRQTYQRLLDDYYTIWLKASPAEHMQRVLAQGDTRPMAGNPAAMEQLKSLLSDREADYADAMYCVDTEGTTSEEALESLLEVIEPALPRAR